MSLHAADLAQLLRNRPELAVADSPDLLERLLKQPEAAVPALLGLDTDCHLVSQALQILGGKASHAELAELLHDPGGRLEESIGTLAAWGLVSLDGGTVVSPHQPGLWAHPFGLGRPLRDFAQLLTADVLKSMVKGLGGKPQGRKQDLLAQAETLLRDGQAVRRRAAGLPEQALTLLESLTAGPPVVQQGIWYGSAPANQPIEQLAQAGFVIRDGWDYELPREVALALRGDGWKPELTGQPGVPSAARPVSDGVAAALAAVDRIEALVDLAGAEPVTELKAGGVGTRELRRVAKALDVPEQSAALWLDLAFGTDLIASELGERLVSTTVADDWLARPAAARWQALAECWIALPQAASFRVPGCCAEHMTPQAPPYQFECGAGDIRRATLRVLRTLPDGHAATPDGLLPAVGWRSRAAREHAPATTEFLAAALREGELLGMVQDGALTTLGRALLDGGEVAELFPTPSRTVTLQHDLTAIVAGTPAPELAAFLNGCADLESRDRASVWRLSEGSVRRALDAGATAESLLAELERCSAKSVPQPLRYLVTDVARRHGAIRVTAAASVVTSDDPTLITELCGSKALRKLALRPVAPTVALSALPPDETLRLLRQAGHAPVGVAADGTVRAERPQRRRLAIATEPDGPLDAEAAALAILDGTDAPAPGSVGETLRLAAVTGGPVIIVWQRRDHYMDDLRITGGSVTGYCHDCDGGHTFPQAKIKEAELL
ncbi:helicase-associated domain-containing protein [Nonomuraea jiangxiensis]|uniref:Predicted ATPase n=1 Tax=Nonomuraea jiangxiensis TaxID=633440 RepID=A0A1G8D1Z5_9ACTN|nr:helicase-associated domain-containing protein [Nonomuraea jiangxiensis]SDH51756.1 Predicted ATPase [Nonomuraea jiangxiensis]